MFHRLLHILISFQVSDGKGEQRQTFSETNRQKTAAAASLFQVLIREVFINVVLLFPSKFKLAYFKYKICIIVTQNDSQSQFI